MKQFKRHDRVTVSPTGGWKQASQGFVVGGPEPVTTLKGPELYYWIEFDTPQATVVGNDLYRKAQILSTYLEPACFAMADEQALGHTAVELHDSEVERMAFEGQTLHVCLRPAYVHRSEKPLGQHTGPSWGYLQPVDLVFQDAQLTSLAGTDAERQGHISSGVLRCDEKVFDGLIPLPSSLTGKVTAELVFATGAIALINASSVACRTAGEADKEFLERVDL